MSIDSAYTRTRKINTNYQKSNIDCSECLFLLTHTTIYRFVKTIFGSSRLPSSICMFIVHLLISIISNLQRLSYGHLIHNLYIHTPKTMQNNNGSLPTLLPFARHTNFPKIVLISNFLNIETMHTPKLNGTII